MIKIKAVIEDLIRGCGEFNTFFSQFLFTIKKNELEFSIRKHIELRMAEEAWEIIKSSPHTIEMIYNYSPALYRLNTALTVKVWQEYQSQLDIKKIIPIIDENPFGLGYLQSVAKTHKGEEVHNLLIQHYILQGKYQDFKKYLVIYSTLRLSCSQISLIFLFPD